MSPDPLEYLPFDKWETLEEVFKSDWPRGISGYNVLKTQRKWKQRGAHNSFIVYCPFGDVKNGMVAMNQKFDYYEVIIQCSSDDTNNLKTALIKTNLIDWNRNVIIPYAVDNVIECVKEVAQILNLAIKLHPADKYVLNNKIPREDVTLPTGITFGHITMQHLDLIDSTWPHRYPTSPAFFQQLINLKCGYGLFYEDALISWLLINEAGTLTHVYTVEEHRYKGYAGLLIKIVSNILMQEGSDVFGHCVEGNEKASKMYKKLGFELANHVAWCHLLKNKK